MARGVVCKCLQISCRKFGAIWKLEDFREKNEGRGVVKDTPRRRV